MNLTIYIPTYRRHELTACLDSIIPQLNSRCELYVSDNDPEQSAYSVCQEYPHVNYMWNYLNIGADGNCLRGLVTGQGEYVWVFGDDDIMLPGAIEATFEMMDGCDRIIHVGDRHGEIPFGFSGHMSDLLDKLDDKSFIVASTLCSMNVWKRAIMDPSLGITALDTRNVLCWAGLEAANINVANKPYLQVGRDNQTFFPHFMQSINEYLINLNMEVQPEEGFTMTAANHWNYNNV